MSGEHVNGSYEKYYNDLLVNASNNVNAKIIEAIEPFDLDKLEHYEPEYLSGFTAERYSVGLDEGWEEVKKDIVDDIHSGVVKKIGGDRVRYLNIDTSYNGIWFKHILLPVWMSSYKFKDKVYRFMINGETGEVQGKSPVSVIKIILTIIIILGAIGLAGAFFGSQ